MELKKRLKKAFGAIRRYIKESGASGEYAALAENYYLIEKAYRDSLCALYGADSVYGECARYLGRCGWKCSDATFFEHFKGKTLSLGEVYSLGSALNAALIISAGEELDSLFKGRRCDGQKLTSSVLSLHKVGDIRTEKCFETLCDAEKLLCEKVELYRENDRRSKNMCREAVIECARKRRISEPEAVEYLCARPGGVYAAAYGKTHRAAFFAVFAVLAAAVMIPAVLVFGYYAVFAALSVLLFCGALSDRIFSRLIKPFFPLRLDVRSDASSARTLVVYSTLLFGNEKDENVFAELESAYLRNRDADAVFGILADLPDSAAEKTPSDDTAVEGAVKRINKLNGIYGEKFALFLRGRTFNVADGVWTGRERKRGAVCELALAVTGGKMNFAHSVNARAALGAKYILTLDSDTVLPLGAVRELTAVSLHPANRPVISEGRVVKGHAVFQPRIKTGLRQSYATYFTLLRSESGSLYETASYDRYQSLFGRGIFCGKGLIDAAAFAALIPEAFPENVVLSHDIPEGCVLRCMFVPDMVFTDSSPKNPVSAFLRLHRWIRGDLQNLSLLFMRGIGSFGRYVLLGGAARQLAPLSAACGAAAFAFSAGKSRYAAAVYALLLLSYAVTPAVFSVIGLVTGRSFTPAHFFSVMISRGKWIVCNLIFELCAFFEYAFRAADAAARSAYRMLVSHKKTLEWTTFSQTDSRSFGVTAHVSAFFACAAAGALFAVFSPYAVFRALGSAAFVMPVFSYLVSSPVKTRERRFTQKQNDILKEYAREQFAFFSDRVNEKTNFLPPDNVQLSPAECTAERTSPTNIGLYLLCLAAAHDFGFIPVARVEDSVEKAFRTIAKLEKYRGHLYNWYDTRSLCVIGEKYISTVDSGNFVTMLVTLSHALRSYGTEKCDLLAGEAEALAENTDFSFLYDDERELFYTGYSLLSGVGNGHYDMLMSEIRTTCYYACAAGIVPKAHWNALSRAVTEKNGFVGMISWAGSAFEYFMPQLFLPSFANSFLDETLSFAAYCQRGFRRNRLWGVSESGYYAFDADMNYQYKAHGVPALALKKYEKSEFTVSPYSVFLMMERSPDAAFKAFAEFEKRGMRGEYGFYEAFDLSGGGMVRSFMAHHVGMSILACANACFDGIFRKRFFGDKRMAACDGLLCESIPSDVYLYRGAKAAQAKERPALRANAENRCSDTAHPRAALYRGGNLSLISSSDGRIALQCGAFAVARAEFSAFSPVCGVTFGAVRNNKPYACLPSGSFFSARFGEDSFAFMLSDPECPLVVKGMPVRECGAYVFDVRAGSGADRICMNFTPVLDKPGSYKSHPAFSRLFVTSSYLQNENAIVFRRRTEPGAGRYPMCAVALGCAKTKYEYRTDSRSLRSHSRPEGAGVFALPCDGGTGVCIEPDCTVRVPAVSGGEVRFIIACGYTMRELTRSIAAAREAKITRPHGENAPFLTAEAISGCVFSHNVNSAPHCDSSALWKLGVSGDAPLLTLELYGKNEITAQSFLDAYREINGAYLKCELLFIVHEPRGYSMPVTEWIKEKISSSGLGRYYGRRGGIFAVNALDLDEKELAFVRGFSAFFSESDSAAAPRRPYTDPAVNVIRASVTDLVEKIVPPSVFVSGTPPLPRSYIMAGYSLGALVTEKTLGFTFYGSARDRRISAFDQDPYARRCGEELLMLRGGNVYDLVSLSDSVEYRDGAARYKGAVCGVSYSVTVFVAPKLPVKVITAEFENAEATAALCVAPEHDCSAIYGGDTQNALFIRPLRHSPDAVTGFVMCFSKCERSTDRTLALTGRETGLCYAACLVASGARVTYCIGACPAEIGARRVIAHLEKTNVSDLLKESCEFVRSFIPPQTAFTQSGGINALYSVFAPYQTAFSRFLGRTGFYQTGGAYGFRDQLQDCLCLVYSRPDLVRTHLIRASAHQYKEGDVMHWWLKNGGCTGTRTACSDDMLYLPLVAADYCEKTGDTSVLRVKVPYLDSPPLAGGERFETAARTEESETVYMHCLRAILCAAGRTGAHGLSLMGSCDWNDGFSAVGRKGKGESVFTTFLLAVAARRFARVCEKAGDTKSRDALLTVCERACSAGENCFKGDRFPRGTFDDGAFFGVKESRECAIDVISQALAAIALGKTEKTVSAVNAAYRELYDKEKRIFKLFSPPFENVDAGYISAYPGGVRENGGQYTHGALWGVMGLVICGEYEKALAVMSAVTPAGHTDPEEYKLEPYVIAADIYSTGRGGWSWYTGSAAWFYKIMTEQIMGIRFKDGFSRLTVVPACEYTFVCERNGYKLKIISSRNAEGTTLDGLPARFPLDIPSGEHVLRVKAPY